MNERKVKYEEFSSEIDDVQFEKFIHSIKTGNFEDTKSYFNEKFSNKTDKYGLQPIHWASLNYNVDIFKWMLEKLCSIESSSKNGWRPIHFATFAGDEEMVKCLIKKYCKLDCQTDGGETVLDVANGYCDREFIDGILNETNNLKVALSMRLKCDINCDHKFCLTSVLRGKFHEGENIDGASFAKIYKVRESQSNRLFAVKMIWKDKCDDTNNMPKYILPNINLYLTKLIHENIVKYYGMIETPTKWNIFIEWMDKGSIFDEIRSTGSLPDHKIIRYCKDILQAVAFLHDNSIVHRRINPGNLLIDNNGRCKLLLSDLSCLLADDEIDIPVWSTPSFKLESVSVTPISCSLISDDFTPNFCGTQYYIAPEIKDGEPYNYPADIWCVGATVIHMLTGNSPYRGFKIDTELNDIVTNRNLEYTSPRPISNEMHQFIEDMINPDPYERPIANDLLNYELIKNVSIDCEINNLNIDQTIDYSTLKRQRCQDLINNAIENNKIGISMGLKCLDECNHTFCLSSVTATNFEKGKKIGKGGFGEVYKLNFKSDVFWAMKIIENVDDENIKKEAKCFEDDINRYREFINHENIVKYFGAVRNLKKVFIFMEFIDGESLYQKIKKNKFKPLPLTTIKRYTKQILKGLKFLHEKDIIHRDIKSKNILINKNNIVKIADFGTSRFLRTISKNQQKTFCGTANYLSPEMISDKLYNCSADIWSLGATVFEMATGHPPYHDMDECAVIFKIGKDKIIEYPSDMSENIKTFLNSMINVEPENRSNAESLLSCKFLN